MGGRAFFAKPQQNRAVLALQGKRAQKPQQIQRGIASLRPIPFIAGERAFGKLRVLCQQGGLAKQRQKAGIARIPAGALQQRREHARRAAELYRRFVYFYGVVQCLQGGAAGLIQRGGLFAQLLLQCRKANCGIPDLCAQALGRKALRARQIGRVCRALRRDGALRQLVGAHKLVRDRLQVSVWELQVKQRFVKLAQCSLQLLAVFQCDGNGAPKGNALLHQLLHGGHKIPPTSFLDNAL